MTPAAPVLVMGTGAVGAYVGGQLQAVGATVHFVGRATVLEALRAHGLTVSDLDGHRTHVPPSGLQLHERCPSELAPALALLCVKSGDTAAAAAELGRALPQGTPVVSLQNGIGNPAVAATAAPALHVVPGMVGFNVAAVGPGHWHRGTWGVVAVQDDPLLARWLPVFAAAGLPLQRHADLCHVQWGKLLLNLNNPVNALSGLPLKRQLLDRDLRFVFAALVDEALAALAAHGMRPARLAALPPAWMPAVLRLPTALFRIVAARNLRIDDEARSSMADDVARGRPTEIDALSGEVVRLAAAAGLEARCNAWMVERLAKPHPGTLSGAQLRRALGV